MRLLIATTLSVLAVDLAAGAMLCQKRSGLLVVRESCKKKEKPVDPIALGLQGPKGDRGDAGIGPLGSCPPDAVLVGTTCVDKYEASVWQVPDTATALVELIKKGEATVEALTDGGATQLGCTIPPFGLTDYPARFPPNGQWVPIVGSAPPSPGVYAVSIAGVLPSTCLRWFQADQACALSGKRLITNQEWQRAAAGTPDPGATDDDATQCEIGSDGAALDPVPTGSRPACVSQWGAFDMIGNAEEWVADWVPVSTTCPGWTFTTDKNGDDMCLAGASTSSGAGALKRGGYWSLGASAGVFAVDGTYLASEESFTLGFRCAR
jgi:hypothetical protein